MSASKLSALRALRTRLSATRTARAAAWLAVNLVLAFGVGILTARMLGPNLRGTLALSITAVAILVLVTALGSNVVIRGLVPRGTVGLPAYFRLTAKLFVGHVVVTVVAVVLLARFVDPALSDPFVAVPVIVAGCLYFWGVQLGDALNAAGRIVESTASVTAATAAILIGVVISFSLDGGLIAVVYSYLIGWAVRCAILLVELRSEFRGATGRGEQRTILAGAPGAVLLGLGQAVTFQAAPLLLALLSKTVEVGYFAAVATPAAILRLPAVSMGQVLMHDIASGAATPRTVWLRIGQALAIGLAPAAAAFAGADWLVRTVLGEGFAAAVPVFQVLLLAEILLTPFMILGTVLVGYGETLGAGATSAAGAVVFVVLAVILIPSNGALGGAWASAGASAAVSAMAMLRFRFAVRAGERLAMRSD